MISAFSQKVSELETKLDNNTKSIEELQCQFKWKAKDKTEGTPEESGTGKVEPPSKEVQRILLSFQGELKDQSFMVNTLQSRVYCHQEELRALRTYVQEKIAKEDEIENLKRTVEELCRQVGRNKEGPSEVKESTTQPKEHSPTQQTKDTSDERKSPPICPTRPFFPPSPPPKRTIPLKLNPDVPEFKPRFQIPPPPNSKPIKKDKGSSKDKVNDGNAAGSSVSGPLANVVNVKKRSRTISEMQEEMSKDSSLLNELEDFEEANFTPELMRQKLFEKSRVVLEAERRLEEALLREADCNQHLVWAEHKIRLLKHDKRSRGETIGKLLRCVDEIRDMGKIDLNAATAERAILTTTLSTRGMPHEERIQVAINVTEAERLHHYCPDENSPRFGPEGMETSPDQRDISPSGSQCSSLFQSYSYSNEKLVDADMD